MRRSHGFHRPWRIWLASLFLALAFLSFFAFLGLAIALPLNVGRAAGIGSLVCLGISIGARLAAFVLARRLVCGLCHGTVLSEKKCRKHVDAARIPPLSHRATTALQVLCTRSFRCMYCGTRFRLWK